MIYIIYGQEQFFIRQKIDEIIKENDAELIRYDGSSKYFNIGEMLENADSNSLFSTKNIILVNEPYFLIKKTDDDLDDLYHYISDPYYQTDLIFYTYNNNFNTRLNSFKTISANAQVFEFKQLDKNNFPNYAKQRINEAKLDINNEASNLLINIVKNDATLLEKNIELLSLYPEKITVQVISKLCSAYDEIDSYELINALTNKDISKTISLARKLSLSSENGSIIYLLANQLRFLYYVAYLLSIGKKKNEIMELTNSREYRYIKAVETINKLKMNNIMNLLHKLSDLDIKSKSDSTISDDMRFELFVLELLKE